MTDHAELRRLAEACDVSRCADEGEERRRLHDFYDCIEPELILSMLNEIAENDSVVAVWRGRTQRAEEERDRLKAENEALRGALQAVVDDPTWRSNDNTLWPKIIKALGKGATQ
ncbi:ead/Ea22-like family protein [Pseudomonas aeruginosa]|uniref:ead/Ea22-like family protein n=1 Tax=Pseudomonas aeruginosa TaxID=287 RepID=UPI003888B44F